MQATRSPCIRSEAASCTASAFYGEFLARGVESRRYELADHTGRVLRRLDMSVLTGAVGPVVMLPRAALIAVLRGACGDLEVRMGATVERIDQAGAAVRVVFNHGARAEFDLLVACEGIHSRLRAQVFGEQEVFDTGWTIWTWWGREGLFPLDLVREYWGRGFFFGAYPVLGRCMFAAGLPNGAAVERRAPPDAAGPLIASALRGLSDRAREVRLALDDARALFAWPMADVRAREWYSGRVALCGDAAAAFLPTAGVGASNAMRSAAALADELSRSDAAHVPLALDLYVKRCRKLVLRNQDDSRAVARYMFTRSKVLSWGRDQFVKRYPARRALKQIIRSMRRPF